MDHHHHHHSCVFLSTGLRSEHARKVMHGAWGPTPRTMDVGTVAFGWGRAMTVCRSDEVGPTQHWHYINLSKTKHLILVPTLSLTNKTMHNTYSFILTR